MRLLVIEIRSGNTVVLNDADFSKLKLTTEDDKNHVDLYKGGTPPAQNVQAETGQVRQGYIILGDAIANHMGCHVGDSISVLKVL